MELTPIQIIEELSKYIIGQDEAKRAVAVALRNRYRRSMLPEEDREEITPKNIIMRGPTGVGKTEIARRLAKLVKAPFIKVEATKFTEVGYVGRDVESMVRDLVEASIRLVKEERINEVSPRASEEAYRRVSQMILPIKKKIQPEVPDAQHLENIRADLISGKLDNIKLRIELQEKPKPLNITPDGPGAQINLNDFFPGLGGQANQKKRVSEMYVKDIIKLFIQEESEKLIDMNGITMEALRRAEQEGIIFIDEIDKITSSGGGAHGPEVSREGVQRDILPIVEGCTISTKHGSIRTDFILFIAAGAFHVADVKDLIPELQGRFPLVVDLESLTKADFVRILTEPQNAITKMYAKLLQVDNAIITFLPSAIDKIAEIAEEENIENENLGARRLHSIIEKLLEELSFTAAGQRQEIQIDVDYVTSHLAQYTKDLNLKKYIL